MRKLAPWVSLHTERGEAAEFLVVLADQADLSPAEKLATKAEKGTFVYRALWQKAQETQKPLRAWLDEHRIEYRSFYIVNLLLVKGTREVALELARRSDVARIDGNPVVRGLVDATTPAIVDEPPSLLKTISSHVAYTNAPAVWALGFTGQGIVVGGQDTGYQWDHPAIINQYRGWNGTTASHSLNWHDSIHSGGGSCGANTTAPCDDNSHGTHTMGTVCGDDGATHQIGMAPGARWIGCRDMDQGNGTPATYLESFEWFLAPYPLGGTPAQGNPLLGPDLTTNSWGCPTSEGCSPPTLLAACAAQRAAGIMTVVAAGNSGPSCGTVTDPPAIYDDNFTVGSHSISTGNISSFSSRGPVTVDSSNRMKPDIAAPGQGVSSSVPGNSYASLSGTSMATPHVAGAVALLWSARPALRGQITATEQVLMNSAVHVNSTSCSSSGSPNNTYGAGRLDVLAAVNAVYSLTLTPPTAAQPGPRGGSSTYTLTITNTSYVAETFGVSLGASTWSASASGATVGPIAAGATQSFTVTVSVPANAALNSTSALTVTVGSLGDPAKSAASTLTTTAIPSTPILTLSQPGGPGTGVFVANDGLLPGHEYFNLFSLELCPGAPGSGPLLGLCATDVSFLIFEVSLPVGTPPIHFVTSTVTTNFGPLAVPPGLSVDALAFDFTGAALGPTSPVVRFTSQ